MRTIDTQAAITGMKHLYTCWLVCLLVIASLLQPTSTHAQEALCFDVPGITDCIEGRFREFWEQNGGLPVFGYPISPATSEQTAEGTFLTQYFERNRFELHPELQPPYDVLLGRLGADRLTAMGTEWQKLPTDKGGQPGCLWFPQTGHNVCNQGDGVGFLQYWESHGLLDLRIDPYARSLALFGLPLSPAQYATNTQGDRVITQWFERARLEWHPNNSPEYQVLLGLLGQDLRSPPTPTLSGRILFVAPNVDNTDLYMYDAATRAITQVTNTPTDELFPVWSPDGQHIAFAVEDGARSDIYTMRADGSERVQLTTEKMQGTHPAWSSNGQIAFVSVEEGANSALYVMQTDGSNVVQLTNPTGQIEHDDPVWSPDGNRIAFTAWGAGSAGTSDIHIINADGTNERKIAWSGGYDWDPAWSPDGRYIAFSSSTGPTMALRIVAADGDTEKLLTYNADNVGDPVWSPDGRFLLLEDATFDQENETTNVYVMPFEEDGAPVPQTPLFEHLEEGEVDWTAN